jgi:hypothetical protein
MTLRERLADWISGGALTRARISEHEEWEAAIFAEAQARNASLKAYVLQERLNRIAAMETPNANATVKRMAKIAREAQE